MPERLNWDQLVSLRRFLRAGHWRHSGEEIILPCPACGTNNHLYLNSRTGLFLCFRCGVRGKIEVDVGAVRQVAGPVKGESGDMPFVPLDKAWVGDPSSSMYASMAVLASTVRTYLTKRGVFEHVWNQYDASLLPFVSRVFFPVYEAGRCAYYVGRSLGDEKPKTIEPRGADKPLFGRHKSRIVGDPVVLVEGAFDHFATPNSYAIMGSYLTRRQIAMLKEDGPPSVWVLFDPDADDKATKAASMLADAGILAHVATLDGDRDPADLGRDFMVEVVKDLVSVTSRRGQRVRVTVPEARPP